MTDPYLIAHVVRGEPAFDIAEQMEVNGEIWWIIPTSGHRAYPYWTATLEDLGIRLTDINAEPDPLLPDHYAPSAAPRGQGLITNLAERLGFVPKPPTITRR